MNVNPMERPLAEVDPEIAQAIENEERRQHEGLELIASENFVSEAVLEAAGSVFTNKYAEGYPGKRYYGGCEFTDVVENLARDRAKQLFGAEHANVQPHSGSTANMAAYAAVIKPGDTILGLNLAHGGHLTHGHPLNFSGKTYKIVPYGVTKETETIDYDELERIAERERPKLIIGGGSAYPRIIDFARMRQIADKVGAIYLVDMAHFAGTGRWRRASFAGAARADRHHHHAQDAARSARRPDPLQSRSTLRRSTKSCSRECKAARWCTSLPPRRSASTRPCSPASRTTRGRSWPTPRCWRRRWPTKASTSFPAAPTLT